MLFTGTSDPTIDAKGRLALPAKHRDQAGRDQTTWFCVPWPGVGLRLYPKPTFIELSKRQDDTLTPAPAEADLESTLFPLAEEVELDANGRLALPKHLLELVGLKDVTEVMVIGARNRLEVRNRAEWIASLPGRFQAMATNVTRIERPHQ